MSAAAKVLERARAADVRLEARGRRLAYDAPANVSPDLLAQLRECKFALLELLQHERRELLDLATDPKAKTRCLSSLIDTLSPSRVPHRWPAATWRQFIADAQAFCRDWAERAFLSGWPAWELFGCHRRAPWGRIQGMGLVLLLRGDRLAALTASEAVIRTQTARTRPSAASRATRCIPPSAAWSGSSRDGGRRRPWSARRSAPAGCSSSAVARSWWPRPGMSRRRGRWSCSRSWSTTRSTPVKRQASPRRSGCRSSPARSR